MANNGAMEPNLSLFSWPVFITGVSLYCPTILLLQKAYAKLFPDVHAKLKRENTEFLYGMYFADIIGTLIILINAPACYIAIRTVDRADDQFGVRSPLTLPQQVCLGARTFQFTAEMQYAAPDPRMFLHHTLSLLSQAPIFIGHAPRRQLYYIYFSMSVELISSAKTFLAAHKVHQSKPRAFWWVALAHILGWVLRLVFNIHALNEVLFYSGGSPLERFLNGLGHLVILGFGWDCLWKNCKRTQICEIHLQRPAFFLFLGKYKIFVIQLVLKISLALKLLSTLLLLTSSCVENSVSSDLNLLVYSVLCCISGLLASSATGKQHYWLEGDIALTTLLVIGSSAVSEGVDAAALLASAATSLLLQEAVILFGRHFDEVSDVSADNFYNPEESDATPSVKDANSLHLVKSLASLLTYITIVGLLLHKKVTLSEAGALAIVTRGIIGIFFLGMGSNFPSWRISAGLVNNSIVLCQSVGTSAALFCLYRAQSTKSLFSPSRPFDKALVYAAPAIVSTLSSGIVLLISSSSRCRKIASWITCGQHLAVLIGTAISVSAIVVLLSYPDYYLKTTVQKMGETAPHVQVIRNTTTTSTGEVLWHLATSPAPVVAMIGTLLVPTKLISLW